MRAAVFLDRDGVLNEVVFRDGRPASPRSLAELVVVPGAAQALLRLEAAGFFLLVVTNQPDVARGKLSSDTLEAMHEVLRSRLPLLEIAACVHDDADRCACRKPRPGAILALAARHGVELSRSFLVGDSMKDVEAGRAAGVTTILLRRDYNLGGAADHVVDELAAAVELILSGNAAGEQGGGA
jgi:D-glycero-D-manno-heptose 1,7-bisphosphate phosphatase